MENLPRPLPLSPWLSPGLVALSPSGPGIGRKERGWREEEDGGRERMEGGRGWREEERVG